LTVGARLPVLEQRLYSHQAASSVPAAPAASRAVGDQLVCMNVERGPGSRASWASYPILEMQDAPEKIDIVLINRPNLPATGAGEPSTRTVPAAIANAIFDATGVRLRRVPLTPERVKAALARA
jgi:hypothetical protein